MSRIHTPTEHSSNDGVAADNVALLHEVTSAAAEIFTERPRRAAAVTYLRQRGIDASSIPQEWPLGYAPPGWTRLVDTLAGHFTDDALLAAGVARRSNRGTIIDTFRDRVIFPIHAVDGEVAGFTGRDLSGAPDAPKYINTVRNPIFDKSAWLYGFWEGRVIASGVQRAVVVEGPLDVLAISARGRADGRSDMLPVAACGTAFTIAHARPLVAPRLHAPVVIAMDGDAAGRSAASTIGELFRHLGADARIAMLPNGVDPADLLARGGDLSALESSAALPLITFHVERAIAAQGDRVQWIEGRLAAGRAIASYLATYAARDAGRQIGWISDTLKLDTATFTDQLVEAYEPAVVRLPPLPRL